MMVRSFCLCIILFLTVSTVSAFEGIDTVYVKSDNIINVYNVGICSYFSVDLMSISNSTTSTEIAILDDNNFIGVTVDVYIDGEYYDSCNGTVSCDLYALPETHQNHEFQYIVSVSGPGYLTIHTYTFDCYLWNLVGWMIIFVALLLIASSICLVCASVFRCSCFIMNCVTKRMELSRESLPESVPDIEMKQMSEGEGETEIKFEKFIV